MPVKNKVDQFNWSHLVIPSSIWGVLLTVWQFQKVLLDRNIVIAQALDVNMLCAQICGIDLETIDTTTKCSLAPEVLPCW